MPPKVLVGMVNRHSVIQNITQINLNFRATLPLQSSTHSLNSYELLHSYYVSIVSCLFSVFGSVGVLKVK